MSRLVVVSNRVADLSNPTQTGGLAVAVADALRERGGVWFGWDGETRSDWKDHLTVDDIGNVQRVCASMSMEQYSRYYLGYSNSVVWPLFHYRLDLVRYQSEFFEGYCEVNENFADALLPHLTDDDLVWVHDYHLIPFAHYLRKRGARQRLGFFLHIPFPPPDLLAASPNHTFIVETLLEYDVIGFQTHSDLLNFRHYVEEYEVGRLESDNTIRVGQRVVVADRFPIGIDVQSFQDMAAKMPDEVRIDEMRRNILGRKQIIGVDRLDYSKGLPARFEAFARLLAQHPEMEKAVSLLQIAPPTRENISAYSEIREELESLSGSINGRFAEFDWTPIRYIHRSVPRDKLAPLFRTSHVGMVTPLRDGMNLVAKEYVAAQDEADPGVLVLSQFAGAAEEMGDAVIVNPHDPEDLADKLHTALTMPLAERRTRHEKLLDAITRQDISAWREAFLALLAPQERKAFAPMPDSTAA